MFLLVWLAVLPTFVLSRRVLSYDKIEKEPAGLLIRLFVLGMLTCLPAGFLEGVGEGLISSLTDSTALIAAFMYLIVVPGSEEGMKYLALRTTRKNPNFNYTFDGIVYGVMVTLGFATLENILYVVSDGTIGLAVMRGVLSVPMHCTCGVFMGYHYGVAKSLETRGFAREARTAQRLSLMVPWVIHGLYDYALALDSWAALILGLAMTLFVFVRATRQVRIASANDQPIMVETRATFFPSLFSRNLQGKNNQTPPYHK